MMDRTTAGTSVRAGGIRAGGSRTAVAFGNFGTIFRNSDHDTGKVPEKYPFKACLVRLSILVFLLLCIVFPTVHVRCGSGRRRGRLSEGQNKRAYLPTKPETVHVVYAVDPGITWHRLDIVRPERHTSLGTWG
jgi:hypothetical protein